MESNVPTYKTYNGLYYGIVRFNDDPKKLGRVRIEVPGVIKPASNWAFPRGGGGPQRGFFDVPDVGERVLVSFVMGELDRPVYERGGWALPEGAEQSEVPQVAREAVEENPAAAPKVKVYESERFVVVIDQREGQEILRATDKISGDSIEIDGYNRGILISGTSGVVIKSFGEIVLEAAQVSIMGRLVLPSEGPI